MGKKRNFIRKQNTHDLLVGTLSIGIPSYMHGEDLVMRYKKNSVEPFNILNSNKSQNLEQ